MDGTVLSLHNHAQDAGVWASSPAASSGGPAGNLLTIEPTEAAILSTLCPTDTYWLLHFPRPVSPGVIALVAHDALGDGVWRAYGHTSATVTLPESYTRLAPNGVTALSNATGTAADLDEDPKTPDGAGLAPTSIASAWSARVQFPTPGSAPATGASRQCFALWVRKDGSGTVPPRLDATLYQGGVALARTWSRTVTRDQWVVLSWSAADLASSAGAGVELRLDATPYADSSGHVGYVFVDAVAWYTPATSTAPTWDSGWLAIPRLDSSGLVAPAPPVPPWNPSLEMVLPVGSPAAALSQVVIHVRCDRIHGDAAPEPSLSAGVAWLGPALRLDRGATFDSQTGASWTSAVSGESLGGARFEVDPYGRRTIEADLVLTQAEHRAVFSRLDARGTTAPVFAILRADQTPEARADSSLYSVVADLGATAFLPTLDRHRRRRLRFEERL